MDTTTDEKPMINAIAESIVQEIEAATKEFDSKIREIGQRNGLQLITEVNIGIENG